MAFRNRRFILGLIGLFLLIIAAIELILRIFFCGVHICICHIIFNITTIGTNAIVISRWSMAFSAIGTNAIVISRWSMAFRNRRFILGLIGLFLLIIAAIELILRIFFCGVHICICHIIFNITTVFHRFHFICFFVRTSFNLKSRSLVNSCQYHTVKVAYSLTLSYRQQTLQSHPKITIKLGVHLGKQMINSAWKYLIRIFLFSSARNTSIRATTTTIPTTTPTIISVFPVTGE